MSGQRRAAFLDRDGTLIEDAHYLADAAAMRLIPGAADAVKRLNAADVLAVVVTNQSGIAQGLLTAADYERTRVRLEELLSAAGARVDASYHCPHHPEVTGPCDCRKPGTGMHREAERALSIDLRRSLYVGDRFRDVAPGLALGGLAVLVPSPSTPPEDRERAEREAFVSPTLRDAVDRYLSHQHD
jgi:D-glycero-D-manno-heptose 1,7-bisphosphate phosphatase